MFSVMRSAGGEGLAHGLMGDTVFTGQLAEAVGFSLAQQLSYNIGRNRGSVGQ